MQAGGDAHVAGVDAGDLGGLGPGHLQRAGYAGGAVVAVELPADRVVAGVGLGQGEGLVRAQMGEGDAAAAAQGEAGVGQRRAVTRRGVRAALADLGGVQRGGEGEVFRSIAHIAHHFFGDCDGQVGFVGVGEVRLDRAACCDVQRLGAVSGGSGQVVVGQVRRGGFGHGVAGGGQARQGHAARAFDGECQAAV